MKTRSPGGEKILQEESSGQYDDMYMYHTVTIYYIYV